jgi:hypothetical protein
MRLQMIRPSTAQLRAMRHESRRTAPDGSLRPVGCAQASDGAASAQDSAESVGTAAPRAIWARGLRMGLPQNGDVVACPGEHDARFVIDREARQQHQGRVPRLRCVWDLGAPACAVSAGAGFWLPLVCSARPLLTRSSTHLPASLASFRSAGIAGCTWRATAGTHSAVLVSKPCTGSAGATQSCSSKVLTVCAHMQEWNELRHLQVSPNDVRAQHLRCTLQHDQMLMHCSPAEHGEPRR